MDGGGFKFRLIASASPPSGGGAFFMSALRASARLRRARAAVGSTNKRTPAKLT